MFKQRNAITTVLFSTALLLGSNAYSDSRYADAYGRDAYIGPTWQYLNMPKMVLMMPMLRAFLVGWASNTLTILPLRCAWGLVLAVIR